MRFGLVIMFILTTAINIQSMEVESIFRLESGTGSGRILNICKNNDYVVVCRTRDVNNNVLIERVSSDMQSLWRQQYNLEIHNIHTYIYFSEIFELPNGNLALFGTQQYTPENDTEHSYVYVLEIDEVGDSIRYFEWTDEENEYTSVQDIVVSRNIYYLLLEVGETGIDRGYYYIRSVEIGDEIETRWNQLVHRPRIGTRISSLFAWEDGSLYVLGATEHRGVPDPSHYTYLIKTDHNGDIVFRRDVEPPTLFIYHFYGSCVVPGIGFLGVTDMALDNFCFVDSEGDSAYYRRMSSTFVERSGYVDPVIPFENHLLVANKYPDRHHDWLPDSLMSVPMLSLYNFNGDSLDSYFWYNDFVYEGDFDDMVMTSDGGVALLGVIREINPDDGRATGIIKMAPINQWNVNKQDDVLPHCVCLNAAYPNPFNSTVTLSFNALVNRELCFRIYDSGGRIVDRIMPEYIRSGENRVVWSPNQMPSGTYFISLESMRENEIISVQHLK